MKIALRITKKNCKVCGQRRALFTYRGAVKFRKDHQLCSRCWHSLVDSTRIIESFEVI